MTSFLFVVKIPISEDEKNGGSSDVKSESDDSSKNKDNESDVEEDKDVSKDADKESPSDAESDATKPSPSKEQPEEQEGDEDWDFGEGDPGEGEDSNLVGVEESGKEVTVSSASSTQSQGGSSANAPATVITNVTPSQRGNIEQLQGREISQVQDGNTVQSKTGKEEVPQEENIAQQPQDGNVTQQENITQQKEDVNSVQSQAGNNSQSQTGNSIPAQGGNVTKTNEPQTQSVDSQSVQDLTGKAQPPTSSAGAGKEKANGNNNMVSGPEGSDKTAPSNEETSPEKVEVTVIGENTEQKKTPKKTFTVEKAQEDSLPVNGVGERNNPLEGIVEHLEKSQSVPPGKLHGELPLPKSLSDDRISDAGKPEFETVKFIDDEPLIEVICLSYLNFLFYVVRNCKLII